VLNREDRAALDHWLSVLPEEVIQRRPWLLMAKAWALEMSWQLARQVTLLSQVEALIGETGGAALAAEDVQLLRGQTMVLRAQEAYLGNQPARSLALCDEALTLLPSDWHYARGGAMLYWGLSMGTIGHGQAAERRLLEEYEALDDKANWYALHILNSLCFNYVNAGRLEAAGRSASVMLQQATRAGMATPQGWAHFFLGLASYQWNDLDAAGVHLSQAVDLRYRTRSLPAHHGISQLALVRQARGEGAEAQRLVEMLGQLQVEQVGQEREELRSLRAGLMLDQGDLEGAFRWADTFTAPVAGQTLLWAEVPHITRARILLARNGADDVRVALHTLDDLLDVVERTHNVRWKITILALRALALDARGDAWQALVALQEAVDLARPGGFLRAFVDLGPRIEGLLGRLAEQSTAAEPIRRILAAFPGPAPARAAGDTPPPERRSREAPGVQPPVEALTARELEILTLLREPLWPKEIARKLHISYQTVKRHTVNIYGKLGVNTRWEAVNRAVELGILPPR
jgi:LuxR family maltose regulon positive regulatory protein